MIDFDLELGLELDLYSGLYFGFDFRPLINQGQKNFLIPKKVMFEHCVGDKSYEKAKDTLGHQGNFESNDRGYCKDGKRNHLEEL